MAVTNGVPERRPSRAAAAAARAAMDGCHGRTRRACLRWDISVRVVSAHVVCWYVVGAGTIVRPRSGRSKILRHGEGFNEFLSELIRPAPRRQGFSVFFNGTYTSAGGALSGLII